MATLEASTQHLIELADQYNLQLAVQESKLSCPDSVDASEGFPDTDSG